MKILEIYVSAFGGVRDLRLELTEGLNTLHRPNGWGKTTLAHFLKAMLYGLPSARGAESERKKYTPWQGGTFGGTLTLETARGRFRVERFFGARESADTFVLYDLSTNMESDAYSARLGEELFGIDADGFLRTALISGKTPRGDCASIGARLSALVEAADDVGDYDDAVETIEKRIRYYQTTGQRGRIAKLEGEVIALERTRDELLGDRERLDGVRRELSNTEAQITALECEATAVREALRAATVVRERAALRAQRETLVSHYSRIRARVKTLDASCGGNHPAADAIGRARTLLRDVRRIASETPVATPLPSRAPLTVGTVIAALAATVFFFLGIFSPMLLIFAFISLVPTLVLGAWRLRARTADRETLRAKETAAATHGRKLERAREALARALSSIGAPDGATDEELAAIAEREVEYRLLWGELHEAKQAISRFDEAHPDVGGASFAEADTEALSARERRIDGELRALYDKRASLAVAVETISQRTEALPMAQAAVTECRQTLETARGALETLLCTQRFLREAKASLSTRYLDLMRARMNEYLSRLSPDAPEALVDASLTLSVETEAGTHKATQLSAGWQDLIELCARLSLADALFEGAERPILILDDPFVNLDDAHLHAGKLLLGELSARYQILYAVCHADRG